MAAWKANAAVYNAHRFVTPVLIFRRGGPPSHTALTSR